MKVLIAGDYCPRDRVAAFFEREDYASVLSEVRELTSQSDWSIVNFECPVTTSDVKPIEKCGPNLRCTPRGVEAIKWAGFNCVTLANNHFLDFGEDGVKETIATLNYYGIDFVGGGLNIEKASSVYYKEVAGKRLAIINCCEHEFSIATASYGGSNPLNPIQQYRDIQEARSKSDHVLVVVHGGHEHFQYPSFRMVETYRFFIDAGADVVINHHQHCYSGYEIYKGKPIFYGLGNFCFDNPSHHKGIWTEGYAVTIDFKSIEPSFMLHPYSQCTDEPKVKLLRSEVFNNSLDELNATIVDPSKLQIKTEQYRTDHSRLIGNIFEPFYNKLFLYFRYRGWIPSFVGKKRKIAAIDFIECESHRERLLFWLHH